jgi:hypothetical protein
MGRLIGIVVWEIAFIMRGGAKAGKPKAIAAFPRR